MALSWRLKAEVRNRWKWLNTFGLICGVAGVVIIFIWGPPQPDLSLGVVVGIEPQNPLSIEHDKQITPIRQAYEFMSRTGLVLIGVGFMSQLIGTWPTRWFSRWFEP